MHYFLICKMETAATNNKIINIAICTQPLQRRFTYSGAPPK